MTLRELISAAKAKQRCAWDHTAELMAWMGNLHTTRTFSRFDFHPMRERPNADPMHLDDPAAEYARLKKEESKKRKRKR